MNGWYRLWIFLALIAGVAFGIAASHEVLSIRPSFTSSTLRYVSDQALLTLNAADPYFGIGKPADGGMREELIEDGVMIQIPSKVKEADKGELLVALAFAAHREARDRKFSIWGKFFGFWFCASLTTLACGHGVAWVIRGFQKKKP